MTRASNTPATRHRRKKIRKQSKSSFGPDTFKLAKERRMRALSNAYVGRKQRKRDFRKVWVIRLNSHVRNKYGLRYSQFIRLKELAHIELDRKQLSETAIKEPKNFDVLIKKIENPW
ncbi:MAG: 50S ribosomal protein L20 [Candidatus Moeniiplasma glomeromycotorum]|nr:50S ribosomal protein L20 [Candidatus Moeniiplasma glomeromycotorum]